MNILLIGNAGATNLGDDALLGGFVVLCRELFPEGELSMLSNNPADTEALYHLQTAPFLPFGFRSALKARTHLPQTLALYKKADLIIHGGGGLYTDSSSRYPIFLWGLHMALAHKYQIPYFCMGQSVGPLRKKLSRSITKRIFQQAQQILVRDPESAQTLRQLPISHMVHTAPDAAFLLPAMEEVIPIEERNNTIILSLRPWECTESILYKLIPLIEQCTEEGLEIAFLPMQRIKEEDLTVYGKLCSLTEAPITLLEPTDFREALAHISKATMLIGMRLHSCIFATMTATPFLALSYTDKVQNFVQTLGLPEQVVNANHVSFPALLAATQKTLTTLHALHNHLSKKRLMLHEEAREIYSAILKTPLQ